VPRAGIEEYETGLCIGEGYAPRAKQVMPALAFVGDRGPDCGNVSVIGETCLCGDESEAVELVKRADADLLKRSRKFDKRQPVSGRLSIRSSL
jgi:hypothetical protein